ncbi:aspartyl-phosphate phosphatase Spo0E family protein [Salipaludibacillus aurantiacus]|nr:aspartyl-phosphate phosphatase Spo0E family protein [Salipaludibacillus aurantiacus]
MIDNKVNTQTERSGSMQKENCLEIKRKELHQAAAKYGLAADQTIRHSQELDNLIIKHQSTPQKSQ